MLLVLCSALPGCAAGTATVDPVSASSASPRRATLVVGVSESAPPVIFKQGDQTAGIEADLAAKLAEALGMDLRLRSMFWPNLILELENKRIDIIMSGMTDTKKRRERVRFSEPYLVTGQQALIRSRDQGQLGSKQHVLGTTMRVGVETNSTGEAFVRDAMPNAERFGVATLDDAVDALVKGNIDVVIYDAPSIQWTANQRREDGLYAVPGLLTRESLAWAVSTDNVQLLDRVNAVLAGWRADGTLQAVLDRWLKGAN